MEYLHWMVLFFDEHKDVARPGDLFYVQGTVKRGSKLDQDRDKRWEELGEQRLFGCCHGTGQADDYDLIHQVCTVLNTQPFPLSLREFKVCDRGYVIEIVD